MGGEDCKMGIYELSGKEERGMEERRWEDVEGEERNKRILEQEKDILLSGRVGMPSPIVKPHRHMANPDYRFYYIYHFLTTNVFYKG